jgi:secretion/DNA translocation related TadE-like protein
MTHPAPARPERGSVSVVMIAVLVLGLVLAMAAGRLGGAMIAKGRAETAADAAALAAADALALGRGSTAAVAAAHETATHNDATLVRCSCTGSVADVVVEVRVRGLDPIMGPARAHSRAQVDANCAVCRP